MSGGPGRRSWSDGSRPRRPAVSTPTKAPPPVYRGSRNPLNWVREHIIGIFAFLAFVYLLLPNAVVVLFSFNNPTGRFNYEWSSFSTCTPGPTSAVPPGMCDSLSLSLKIGLIATLGATILGTMMAFAISRHRFRGRSGTNLLIFLPMATPEVVMGSSLLTLFVGIGIPLGFWTILIAHIMFCVSFVVVTVKARLASLDPAAGAGGRRPVRDRDADVLAHHVPARRPGHRGRGAAGVLAVVRRLHHHELQRRRRARSRSRCTSGGRPRAGHRSQINVVGTLMFLIAVLAVGYRPARELAALAQGGMTGHGRHASGPAVREA